MAEIMTTETLGHRELIDGRRDEFHVLDRYVATNPKLFGSVSRGTASAGSVIARWIVLMATS